MILWTVLGCSLGLTPFNPNEEILGEENPNGSLSNIIAENDFDNDGYTVEEGDCDDENPFVFPNQPDICDSIDNDCDNEIDEDALPDSWETNDDSAIYVGEYASADTFGYEASISDAYDVDRYQVYIEDPIGGFFQINVMVESLTGETDYVVELHLIEDAFGESIGLLSSSDANSHGGGEYISQPGQPFYDDAGLYEIIIYSRNGSSCESKYSLTVQFSV